eukprot:m.215964 g.215964  ORF g.215964 m.215964 type:complete len:618 (+) comp39844_c0_seq45:606-2459(+)
MKQVFAMLVLYLLESAHSYPVGPPTSACDGMTPLHGYDPQPPSSTLYEITTTAKDGYVPTIEYDITVQQIAAGNASALKGFFCQVRPEDLSFSLQGTFIVPPTDTKAKTMDCNGNSNAASHKNPNAVASHTLKWRAPSQGRGNLTIVCTVVKVLSTFWVKVASAPFVELLAPTGITQPPATTKPPSSELPTQDKRDLKIEFTECDRQFCYQDPRECTASNCDYGLVITADTTMATITLSTTHAGMVALGFSNDKAMGNDDVVGCIRTTDGRIYPRDAWNPDGHSPDVLDDIDDVDQTKSFGVYKDGVLSCRIVRKLNTTHRQDYDWNKNWTLLFAHSPSPTDAGFQGFQQHGATPKMTSQRVTITVNGSTTDLGTDITFIKVHGILMIVAWIGLASSGMFLARFYKRQFPNDKPVLCFSGTPAVWFQLHRFLMSSTVLLSIAGFVVIFVGKGGWTASMGDAKRIAHPIIGTICVAFAIAQPVMAFFRCSPDNEKRYIFNRVHAVVGTSAFLLAIGNIFLGIIIAKKNIMHLSSLLLYILIAWIVVLISVEIFLETKAYISMKLMDYNGLQLKEGESLLERSTAEPNATNKKGLLLVYVMICLGSAAAMSIMLGHQFR